MNLFILSLDPVEAANDQCDKHVVKMVTETAQILCTVLQSMGVTHRLLYRQTHTKHPVVLWVAESRENYNWTIVHGLALAAEYHSRYGRPHKSERVIWLAKSLGDSLEFKSDSFTTPEACMPGYCKVEGDIVASYRRFYKLEKRRFAKWAYCKEPDWWLG
jgi:hypothetical protein